MASRYQVRRELGRGGMGFVYLCRDLVLDERVALKLMPRTKSLNGSTNAQDGDRQKKRRHDDAWFFFEEARALAGLSHPTIVRARDYGVLADGSPYIVMDVAPGRSLHEWIYRAKLEGLLPWPVVWTTIDQVLAGLAHAHARGVVHGDLKPSNILLDRSLNDEAPRAYILDLGLAWLTRDLVDHRLDGSREVAPTVRYGAGTPGWMAPEQIRMATPHIGPATDLYPLGCLLYALLVGDEPFAGTNEELMEQHKHAPPPDMSLPSYVPAEAESFTHRLMSKWPWTRYDFAGDARRDWHRLQPVSGAPTARGRAFFGPADVPSNHTLRSEVQTLPDREDREVGVTAVATPGLLGLRPSPLVARVAERQHLLNLTQEVCESEKPIHRLILLSGLAGVGKSRLAEWLCQEVHELALMLPLRARYRKIAAPLDGVVGALVQHYRVEKSKRSTIEKVLLNVWRVAEDDDEGRTWVAGAAAWLCRQSTDNPEAVGPTGKRFMLDRPELKWLVVRKTLEETARGKPLLLWLDDIHHAPADTFQRLARLKRDMTKQPLLLIATLRNEDVVDNPTARARVELLLEEYGGSRMEIEALSIKETQTLLSETLPLDERAVTTAARRSKGNPLFALQLVHAWAIRGELSLIAGRYTVHDDAVNRQANTTAELWEERLQGVAPELQQAALAAAALGGDIRRDVLNALLSSLELDARRAVSAMKRAQLLLPSGTDRLRWTHALLQEHLLVRLWEQPNARQVFRCAADALAHHPAANSGRIIRHRVTNLLRSDDRAEAAAVLHGYVAAQWAQVRDAAATLRDLSLLDGQLDGLSLAHQLRWTAEASRHAGALEDAKRYAETARKMFHEAGEHLDEAQCLRLRGHIASDLGASEQGLRLVSQARTLFQEHGHFSGQAQCEVLLGEIYYLIGDHSRATELLNMAAAKFHSLGDLLGRAQAYILLGFIEQSGGSPSRSRELLSAARADLEGIGYRLGVAQCDVALAHADHREGNFAATHERATQTLKAFHLVENPRGEAGCERLLAMNALDGGHPNTAEVHARAAGALYSRLDDPWGKVESLLLLAQVALYRGDVASARDALIHSEAVALSEAEPKQHRHLTLAWLASCEGRYAEAARQIDAARRAFRDTSQSGDHTPQLLVMFDHMGWPNPAGGRIKSWLSALSRR